MNPSGLSPSVFNGLMQNLLSSGEFFQTVIETAGSAIICLSPAYEIFVFNREAERLFGFGREEVLGQNYITRFVLTRHKDAFMADLNRVMDGHALRDFEKKVTDRKGRSHYVNWNVDRLLDSQGRVTGIIACGQDRTERKKTEQQVRTTHERFKTVMDSLEALVYVSDFESNRLLFLNHHGERIWGKWEGRICWEVLQARDRGPCEFCTNPLLIDETGWPSGVHVWEFRNKVNGRWYECRDQAIHWTDGRLVRLEIATDITERKRAEEALREKEEYLRTIMATIQTGVIIKDSLTGIIADVNPFALTMIGREKEKVMGQRVDEFIFREPVNFIPRRPKSFDLPGEPFVLQSQKKGPIQIRLSEAKTRIKGQEYGIISFLDISDLVHLLAEQAVNIDTANRLLGLINSNPTGYIDLAGDLSLYVSAFSIPCKAAGGDHYFIRHLTKENGSGKSLVSLKDQSGHEVNCVLKSIATDLFHNAILHNFPSLPLEDSLARLNQQICKSGLFKSDDFLTAIVAEIDHQSLVMRYSSCGHPDFLLIRGSEIIALPEARGSGRNLPLGVLPDQSFEVGECRLQGGDRLFFYTDGLTEMPLAKGKPKISPEELKGMIREARRADPGLPISLIGKRVLSAISAKGEEEVIPYVKNTSSDDVSILIVEIESQSSYEEEILSLGDETSMSETLTSLKRRIGSGWERLGMEKPERRLGPVLEEAVSNAWRHGNREDPDKKVIVRWRWGNDFHLEVIDQGPGFDYRAIPDPTQEDNRLKETGRGIFMIRFYADEVRWKDQGRHLIATFRRSIGLQERKAVIHNFGWLPLWRQNQ